MAVFALPETWSTPSGRYSACATPGPASSGSGWPGLIDPGLARAAVLDLRPDRLRPWLFARCVQEAIDQPALRNVAARLAP